MVVMAGLSAESKEEGDRRMPVPPQRASSARQAQPGGVARGDLRDRRERILRRRPRGGGYSSSFFAVGCLRKIGRRHNESDAD